MDVFMTALQFTVSCLALGMGLFLAVESGHQVARMPLAPATATRAIATLAGGGLLAAGVFGALLSIPL